MLKDEFFIEDRRYCLSHSIGAQPKSHAEHYSKAFSDPWRNDGPAAWDHWLEALSDFQTALAPLIGARPEDICPQVNVSSALSKIIHGLPKREKRTKIVLTEEDFPTIGFVLKQAERLGYELVFLPGGDQLADADAWSPAFADDVHLVHVTHVFSNSNVRTPVADITRRGREAGVFSIVDVAQSAGCMPVLLDEWRPDFAMGTCLKYLCGGPGAAFLWARPEAAALCEPLDVGWFSHAEPFAYKIHDFRYADNASRFMGGTPSIAPFAGAVAGLKVLGQLWNGKNLSPYSTIARAPALSVAVERLLIDDQSYGARRRCYHQREGL